MGGKSIGDRLRFVGREAVELYCRLFGYSSITIRSDHSIPTDRLLAVGLVEGENEILENGSGDVLFVGDDDPLGRGDSVSAEQFAIDLEAVVSCPCDVARTLSRSMFVDKVSSYLEGFIDRGWSVELDVRPTLSRALEEFEASAGSNADACRILVICDGKTEKYNRLLSSLGQTARIEKYWLAYFLREWSVELLCDRYEKQLKERSVFFYRVNWAWGFDSFFGSRYFPTSEDIAKRSEFSQMAIRSNTSSKGSFLSGMFDLAEEEAQERFLAVSAIPPVADPFCGAARHRDTSSPFLNVVDGDRLTTDVPETWRRSIHLFGGCTFFGYAIEDSNTVASCLQRRLNADFPGVWRVVNHGIWGGNFEHCHKRISDIALREGDVVVVSYAMGNMLSSKWDDLSVSLNSDSIGPREYYDRVVHCGKRGYERIGEELTLLIGHALDGGGASHSGDFEFRKDFSVWPVPVVGDLAIEAPEGLHAYIQEVRDAVPLDHMEGIVGAIVMNCNPFTLGHRHVVEYASHCVDRLYLFVVEEDRSVFPFSDRIELVRKGTADLSNVIVLRSGSFMISSTTFPGYFVKDDPGSVDVDPTLDVEVFGKWVAPALGIAVRFVGQEPFDRVTRNYNEKMKAILPRYGIELVEIPRKTQRVNGVETVISASTVRKLLAEKEYAALSELVPDTTYDYLMSNCRDR